MPRSNSATYAGSNEDEWEDLSDSGDDYRPPQPRSLSTRDEIEELSSKNTTLFMTLCSHPSFNKSAPAQSPRPLWFVADFVRRTCVEYIAPICPSEENGPWPPFDQEQYTDALSRSLLIASVILKKNEAKQQLICGGAFDFGPHVRDLARFLLGTPRLAELDTLEGRLSTTELDRICVAEGMPFHAGIKNSRTLPYYNHPDFINSSRSQNLMG